MKKYTVIYKREIKIVISAENIYDLDNKAKEQCPDGFILDSYEDEDDSPECPNCGETMTPVKVKAVTFLECVFCGFMDDNEPEYEHD